MAGVFWGFNFCLRWGSPGNGLELFFSFVSSFISTFCKGPLGLFGPKVTPCQGFEKPVCDLTFRGGG